MHPEQWIPDWVLDQKNIVNRPWRWFRIWLVKE